MTSNSENMTLEEKIVQNLKDDKLMALVGDEDAIMELVKRAIQESLFKDRKEPHPQMRYETIYKPSPVVEAAEGVAKQFADKAIGEIFEELLKSDEFKEIIRRATPIAIMNAMNNYAKSSIEASFSQNLMKSSDEVDALVDSILIKKGIF